MSKMRLIMTSLALAGYAAGVSAADPSAMLQQPTGRVFVGQTTVMTKAQQGMPLYAGNRVVAATGGGAKVIYPDGCAVALPENSLLTIGNPNQCKAGQAAIHTVGGFQNAPIGQAGSVTSRNSVATVREVKGTGQVDQASAKQGMSLYKGNRVTAGADGQVVVRYSDGCEVVVESGKSMVIDQQPVCTAGLIVGGGGVVVGTNATAGSTAGAAAGTTAGSSAAGTGTAVAGTAGAGAAGGVAGAGGAGAAGAGAAGAGAAAGAGVGAGAAAGATIAGVSVGAMVATVAAVGAVAAAASNNNNNNKASPSGGRN